MKRLPRPARWAQSYSPHRRLITARIEHANALVVFRINRHVALLRLSLQIDAQNGPQHHTPGQSTRMSGGYFPQKYWKTSITAFFTTVPASCLTLSRASL